MEACVKQKKKVDEIVILKSVLQDELNRGNVLSVSPLPQKAGVFRIMLRPSATQETIYAICRKLNDIGYNAKVLTVASHETSRKMGATCYHSISGHYVSGRRARVIVAKVNVPNIPNNPHGLPDPEGNNSEKHQ